MLPMGFGYIEGVTHDYQRHGTTTLFAALNVLDGAVLAQCRPRHRHQEFLAFLRHIEANVPAQLDVHLVVDNYATHKHPKVQAWLARRPRWHIHLDRKSTRLNSSHLGISYAVFCLKKKKYKESHMYMRSSHHLTT